MTLARRTLMTYGLAAAAGTAAHALDAAVRHLATAAPMPRRPHGSHAQHVEAIGCTDLHGRPAFKLAISSHRGRWYLYTGSFWHRGWSIVDVTDPARPEVVNFLDGPVNTFTGQLDLHGETLITSLERVLGNAPWGLDPTGPFEEGVIVWDLADRVRPKPVGRYRTSGRGTHRNTYAGGHYMHLAAGMPGYDGNIYVIVDISDRSAPKEVGRWAVPGQKRDQGAPEGTPASAAQQQRLREAGFGNIDLKDVSHHGPPVIEGTRAWLSYGAAGMIVLDVTDVTRPRLASRLGFTPPFHATFGVHGVLPVPSRGIAFVNSEDTSYGKGPAHHASIVDIRDPARPFLVSLFPEPVPPPGAPYASFSERAGWSGPHNVNHLQHHPDVQPQSDLFYIAHFNAGLRIYDVSHARLPREVGCFMPPEPQKRYGPMPEGPLVTQTEDVLVDRRGFIYISDKNQGLWVLKYTGPAGASSA